MQHPHRIRSGFTLIELLVVIAIISILAAILFPVFARARETARAAACVSNMKQIGLAIAQYRQDYDGFYPFSRVYSPSVSEQKNWYDGYLDPYIKGKPISKCPSVPDNWQIGYSYNQAFGFFPGEQIDPPRTGTTTDWGGACGVHPIYDGINEAAVQEPATSINIIESALTYYYWTIYESGSHATANSQLSYFMPHPTQMNQRYNNAKAGTHNGGLNVLYADGHVKKQNLGALMPIAQWCAVKRS